MNLYGFGFKIHIIFITLFLSTTENQQVSSISKEDTHQRSSFSSQSEKKISSLRRLQTLTCNIPGCFQCQDQNTCAQCTDSLWAQLSNDGKCICSFSDNQKPDSDGYCADCLVPGCASCLADHENFCDRCIDQNAVLQNGECLCSYGSKVNSEGYCDSCTAEGCKNCVENTNKCEICIDQFQTNINENGQCQCLKAKNKLNKFGKCQRCLVNGCQRCIYQFENVCEKCAQKYIFDDGKCLCKEGKKFNTNGQCQICNVEACQICKAGNQNHCFRCIDNVGTNIINGTCHCLRQFEHLNETGYCIQCYIPGCQVCDSKGESCLLCTDKSAVVSNGKCQCKDTSVFDQDGFCSDCSHGCNECDENDFSICIKCIDERAILQNGSCLCSSDNLKLNSFGICQECDVLGCVSCHKGNKNKCMMCYDESSSLIDGKCICPQGMKPNQNGECQKCNVIGCDQCKVQFKNRCESCTDKDNAKIVGGRCVCQRRFWYFLVFDKESKPNQYGICSQCLVQECASCYEGMPNECHRCLDENALIVNGSCKCPSNMPKNPDGFCQQCNAKYCKSCLQGNDSYCLECINDFLNQEGICVCPIPGQKINRNGVCEDCSVFGCQVCDEYKKYSCEQCMNGLILKEHKCFCELEKQSPNEYGQCSLCFIKGCKSCYSDDPQYCRECDNGLVLNNGFCQCLNNSLKVDEKGECRECFIPGCASCKRDDPNICIKCIDCSASIIDGECICLYQESLWDDYGFCSNEYELKVNRSKIHAPLKQISEDIECSANCSSCSNGKCFQCEKGFYLKENKCDKCIWPCINCLIQSECLSCRKGYTIFQGSCIQCKTRKCSECPEVEKCQKCKPGFYLKRNTCFSNLLKVSIELAQLQELGRPFPNFDAYMKRFNKSYTGLQYLKRKQIYDTTVQNLEERQEDQLPTHYTVNHLSDQTPEEYQKLLGYHPKKSISQIRNQPKKPLKIEVQQNQIPTKLNWTQKGAVTSVKDQQQCGSCWAFGAAAVAESTLILNGWQNQSIDLSEQYLLQCTQQSTCDGTFDVELVMNVALKGVPIQNDFPYDPYNAERGVCSTRRKIDIAPSSNFYYNLDDQEIIKLLQSGPLTITVSAENWVSYQTGIIQCPQNTERSHVVLLVGYSQDYWLIKNQWGVDWGELGYAKVTRKPQHNCLIGSEVFDFEKILCKVSGCAYCKQFNPQMCLSCKDTQAELKNGACICENKNKVFSPNGFCVYCEVSGCEVCKTSNSTQCSKCSLGMKLTEDFRCSCENSLELINTENKCELCQSQGCLSCVAGKDSVCSRCIDCSAKIIDGKCTCEKGYRMRSDGYCVLCLQVGCSNCSETQCLDCGEQKQFVDGFCECIDENHILQYGECVCPPGLKYLQSQCVSCEIEDCSKCVSVNNEETCSACGNGKILSNNKCQECPLKGCDKCLSSEVCQKCTDESAQLINGKCICKLKNYWPDTEGFCSECLVPGCDSCLSQNNIFCDQCADEKALIGINGFCECPQGLYLGPDGKCNNCSVVGCNQCSLSSTQECRKCEDTRHTEVINGSCQCYKFQSSIFQKIKKKSSDIPNSKGQCSFCSVRHCASCLDGDVDYCFRCLDPGAKNVKGECTCENGFVFNKAGFCINESQMLKQKELERKKLEEKKLEQEKVQKEKETIKIVSKGFYNFEENGEEKLGKCPVGCDYCVNQKACTNCVQFYYLTQKKQCKRCHSNCKSCSGFHETNCLSCFEKFYLLNNTCFPCKNNRCQRCSQTKCQQCLSPYIQQDNQCIQCPQNCFTCQSTTQCDECALGFTLASTGQCLQCLSSCNRCQIQTYYECQQCAVGYTLSEEKKCQKCSGRKCEPELIMLKSHEKKTLCEFPCLNCVDGKCLMCSGGYKLQQDQCQEDLSCNKGQNCLICPKNYILQDKVCSKCNLTDHNCVQCVSKDQCARCKNGFVLDDMGECVECEEGCENCSSLRFCEKCEDGYFERKDLEGNEIGICGKCKPHCKTCVNEFEICTQCAAGYSIEGWKCVSRKKVQFSFQLQAAMDNFVSKLSPFKIDLMKKLKRKADDRQLTLNSVSGGSSVLVNGSIYIENDSTQEDLKEVEEDFKMIDDLAGMKVLSAQISTDENEEKIPFIFQANNLPIIIGLSIGGLVFIILLVIMVRAGMKKKTIEMPFDE